MLHYKACARTRRQKIADIALMVFGLIAAAYTSIQTVRVRPRSLRSLPFTRLISVVQLMLAPQPVGPPPFEQCNDVPVKGLF